MPNMPKNGKRYQFGMDEMGRYAEDVFHEKPTKEEQRARNDRDKAATRNVAMREKQNTKRLESLSQDTE